MNLMILALGAISIISIVVQDAAAYQPAPRIDEHSSSKYSPLYGGGNSYKQEKNKKAFVENFDKNEIDDRIQVSEPYKSLIQTTFRFALAQSGASKHVNIETAMDLLNDTGFMLSKPSILSKFAKTVVVILATLLTSAFFFPGVYKFADTAWRDPQRVMKSFESYLPNGINERSVINLVGSRAEDFLANIGLTDSSCREQSICQAGELIKCTFPHTAESIIKFVSDHFSRPKYRENKYVNAFLSGFVEQNCQALSSLNDDKSSRKNCFGNLFGSYFLSKCDLSPRNNNNEKQKAEYQTIQVGRA